MATLRSTATSEVDCGLSSTGEAERGGGGCEGSGDNGLNGGRDEGGGDLLRGPQSVQSVPYAQLAPTAPSPPSWQYALIA